MTLLSRILQASTLKPSVLSPRLFFVAQTAYICEKCVSVYSSSQALAKHKRKGKCAETVSDAEFLLLSPVSTHAWQVFCNACQVSVPKRRI